MGDADVIPASGKKFLSFVTWANGVPGIRGLVGLVMGKKGVYGGALTSSVFSQRAMGNADGGNRVEVIFSDESTNSPVGAVRVFRANGQHLEWRDTGTVTPEGGHPVFEQVIHFGREIPSVANASQRTDHMAMRFAYEPYTGALRSLGPTRINPAIVGRRVDMAPHVVISSDMVGDYRGLIAPDKDVAYAASCLTLPPNTGILGALLQHFVLREESGIDMGRLMVHSLAFSGGPTAFAVPGERVEVEVGDVMPSRIADTDIGQIVSASIRMFVDGSDVPFNTTDVSLVVRGNFPRGRRGKDVETTARVRDMSPGGADPQAGLNYAMFDSMTRERLGAFASLNGDWNPLHQIDAVGWAAGLRGVVNPGFGTMAQVETAIRRAFSGMRLESLTGNLVRPVLPGRRYKVEFAPKPDAEGTYWYQVFAAEDRKPGERKVIVAGEFKVIER
jgi:acyl dehydratase